MNGFKNVKVARRQNFVGVNLCLPFILLVFFTTSEPLSFLASFLFVSMGLSSEKL